MNIDRSDKMEPEEYRWHVNLVKDRHHELGLTFEQAEKVYAYEEEKHTNSSKHYFTDWEGWDYELSAFRKILNPEQLAHYENLLRETIQRYEQSLIEQDQLRIKDISYHEEQNRFYETQILPEILKEPFVQFGFLFNDRTKTQYLKKEYKRFLNDSKMQILTGHFRCNRAFKPNELKVELLRHRLSYLLPDYWSFKHAMDEPTKAVANYLIARMGHLPDEIDELAVRKLKELRDFNEKQFKQYYGESGGWHFTFRPRTEEEQKEYRSMILLLMDEEKYGA